MEKYLSAKVVQEWVCEPGFLAVQEVEHDFDLHAFLIFDANKYMELELSHVIVPGDLEEQKQIQNLMQSGAGLNGLEDIEGNEINLEW